jgi:hypothetical protein
MRYAQSTAVTSDKSRSEIERTLTRYGATGFIYGWEETQAVIAFQMQARRIKFHLPMPDKADREFTHTENRGTKRSPEDAARVWEQAGRQRWRALALAIKAKLEAVASGITTFEEEFLAHVVLPNGKTVGSAMIPQLNHAYSSGKMPPLLGHDA